MAKVEGLVKVVAALRAKAAKANRDSNPSVTVGYTAEYAIYVHENLEANHPVGQAKFLEQPAREMARDISQVVIDAMQNRKATLAQALLMGGLRLQRESQMLVPVDTGALRNSAFTRLDTKGS
jgi:hypothetical protein